MSGRSAHGKGTDSMSGSQAMTSKASSRAERKEIVSGSSAVSVPVKSDEPAGNGEDQAITNEAPSRNRRSVDSGKRGTKSRNGEDSPMAKKDSIAGGKHSSSSQKHSKSLAGDNDTHASDEGTEPQDIRNRNSLSEAAESYRRKLEALLGKTFLRYFRTEHAKGRPTLPYKGKFTRLQSVSDCELHMEFQISFQTIADLPLQKSLRKNTHNHTYTHISIPAVC
jgi:hypothetical protein